MLDAFLILLVLAFFWLSWRLVCAFEAVWPGGGVRRRRSR
jgi:hypothetical protein